MSPTFNSVARWEQNVDEMRVFAVERPAAATRHFLDHFGLSGTSEISLASACPGFRRASNQWQATPRRIPGDLLQRYSHRRTRDTQVGVYLFALGNPIHCGLIGESLCPRDPSGDTRTPAWILAPHGSRQVMTIRHGPPARPNSATAMETKPRWSATAGMRTTSISPPIFASHSS